MPDTAIAELLAPENLARIDSYSLLAKVAVEGFISGLHRSLYHGFGSEFFQYRAYSPGDDLKYVDWKALGRYDRFYTKVFQEETNMNCAVILDVSASMDYRGSRAACTKLRYASMAAACLTYLAARQGDNPGFFAYADGLVQAVRPGSRTGHLQRIMNELQRLRPGGKAAHDQVLGTLAESLTRRGLVVLISDFQEAEFDLPRILRHFRFKHHDCLVVQVLDPDEHDLPFTATTRFIDAETGAELVTFPQAFRSDYKKDMEAFLATVKKASLELQSDWLPAFTTDNLGVLLAAYLHRRGS